LLAGANIWNIFKAETFLLYYRFFRLSLYATARPERPKITMPHIPMTEAFAKAR